MTPDELKARKILVKYLIPDNLPQRGLRRLQYYTSFADNPGNYYLGLSTRSAYKREKMNEWVKQGQLVELREAIELPYQKDLYLDSEGRVVIASGFDPKDKDWQIVSAPKELRKARMLLKNIADQKLRVTNKTKIPSN